MNENRNTIDRYIVLLCGETEAEHPNYLKISSVARSIAKLAEVELTDQALNTGD